MSQMVQRSGQGQSDDKINLNAEALTADVEGLTNVAMHVVQLVDSGTVTLVPEYTVDGTYWAALGATIAATDFAPGVGAVLVRSLSDAAGMPIPAKKVRVRASAYGASGEYLMRAAGFVKNAA